MADRQITINDGAILKTLGVVIAIVIQTFTMYNALLSRIEDAETSALIEVKEMSKELAEIKLTLKEREKYIELGDRLSKLTNDLNVNVNEIMQQETNNFRKLTDLERRLYSIEQRLNNETN